MAPVFNHVTRQIPSNITVGTSTETSATFTSTILTESTPTSTAEISRVVPVLKAIPTWAYVLIVFFLLIVTFTVLVFKYRHKVREMVETAWIRRKELSMWKGVEEGRRDKLVEALHKLEGRQGRENDENLNREKEFWGDVELKADPNSSLSFQSQDWGCMYRAGILAKLKTLDNNAPPRFGGTSPPELVVPGRALVRVSWPVVEFPRGMVQWPYFRI